MFYIIYSLIFLLLSGPVLGQEGGLNRTSYQNNQKIENYHCHCRPMASTGQRSKQQTFTGISRTIDDDIIRIGNSRIRLHSIDAPEVIHACVSGKIEWRCDWKAANVLANAKHWVTCPQRVVDWYRHIVTRVHQLISVFLIKAP